MFYSFLIFHLTEHLSQKAVPKLPVFQIQSQVAFLHSDSHCAAPLRAHSHSVVQYAIAEPWANVQEMVFMLFSLPFIETL